MIFFFCFFRPKVEGDLSSIRYVASAIKLVFLWEESLGVARLRRPKFDLVASEASCVMFL